MINRNSYNNHMNNSNNNNYQMACTHSCKVSNEYLSNGCGTPPQNGKCLSSNNVGVEMKDKKCATPITTKYDNDDNEVQLRRSAPNRNVYYENSNDWMYRRPTAPNDIRYSCKSFDFILLFPLFSFQLMFMYA